MQAPLQGSAPFFFDLTLPERWEQLKPTILELYLRQNVPLPRVVNIMRDQYRFHAVEHSYKYYFNLWGVSKSVPAPIKDAAVVALGKRTRGQYSTPDVAWKKDEDQLIPIDKKRVKRHIHDMESKRQKEVDQVHLKNNVFMSWNLPYPAANSASYRFDQFSPFGPTPNFLAIGSPTASRIMNEASPNKAPTPTMKALRGMMLNERAQLFLEARQDDLLKQMEKSERRVLTTYLYQFWLYAFRTAKYWGFGPTRWTADILDFDRFAERERLHSSPRTPMINAGSPTSVATPRSGVNSANGSSVRKGPSSLCNWTVHVPYQEYEATPEQEGEVDLDIIKDSEDNVLPRWPAGHQETFEEKVQIALESSTFSTVDTKDLPVAVTRIASATRTSPRELLHESLAFSIAARNETLFSSLIGQVALENIEDTGTYPLHLLTSFLDGSKTCCNLFDEAFGNISIETRIEKIYVDINGHTVLDNLFIAILKGHTSCLPETVDDKLFKLKRFVGEEVDICGRWDADSPCVRELLAGGHSKIPIEWKHMFCHTSAQTICHCIGRLFGPIAAPKINTLSGLFKKTCQACGKNLQLGPLHSLVLIACHLAASGCPGENLFGILACLVCLLVNGADPSMKLSLSISALMRRDTATECSHEEIDPVELAERVPVSLTSGWTEEVTLGWKIFCALLKYARDERKGEEKVISFKGKNGRNPWKWISWDDAASMAEKEIEEEEEEEEEEQERCHHYKGDGDKNFYVGGGVLGTIWATIQTELVAYRRLTEIDPWLSDNFNLKALLDGLDGRQDLKLKMIEEDMIAPFCKCGRFWKASDEACACVQHVCKNYFANVDVWGRATYISVPYRTEIIWY